MCDQGLFPIWQIDTTLNNRGYRDELRNKMDHVISYSSVNDPIIRFKLMSINNLGKKKKKEWDKFGGNQKGLPEKLEEERDEMELKTVKEGWEATKGIIDVMTEAA